MSFNFYKHIGKVETPLIVTVELSDEKGVKKGKKLTVKFNWGAEVALWKGPNLYFLGQVQHFDSF